MEEKMFLCFYDNDGQSSESNSVYYCKGVMATDKESALDKYLASDHGWVGPSRGDFNAIELEMVE